MKKKGKLPQKRHDDGKFFTEWFGKLSSLPHGPLCLQYIVTISIDFHFLFYTQQSILIEQKPSKLLIYNLKNWRLFNKNFKTSSFVNHDQRFESNTDLTDDYPRLHFDHFVSDQ